jgi:hypothetical protein
MSFRKRSMPLTNTANPPSSSSPGSSTSTAPVKQPTAPGVRTSPSFSVPTTSTGLSSLDALLRLGAGLALGSSIVIEEDGTTDYAGAILRCFASEGVLQGHKVFVASMEQWGAGLPGEVVEKQKREKIIDKDQVAADERMKIAWRYERMGLHGDAPGRIGAFCTPLPCFVFILETECVLLAIGLTLYLSSLQALRIHLLQLLHSVTLLIYPQDFHGRPRVHLYPFFRLDLQHQYASQI